MKRLSNGVRGYGGEIYIAPYHLQKKRKKKNENDHEQCANGNSQQKLATSPALTVSGNPKNKTMTLFYLHWNEEELQDRIEPLKTLDLKIFSHWSTEETAKWGDTLPDIFVISLERLPSHGRQYAQWIWEAKKRQHIPIIFVDGKPDKVQQTKQKFPEALYCDSGQLVTTIKNIMKNEN